MFRFIQDMMSAVTTRQARGAMLLCSLMLIPGTGRSTELIPSFGVSKATDALAGDARYSVGVALRAPILPVFDLEGGISYREDSFFDQGLKVRMWPVTVSGWLTPLPALYAGGGLGWYRTTYDFTGAALAADRTSNQVGVHLGGGVRVPLGPGIGLDLNGRYVFMQEAHELALPSAFDPDFWNASLGLAIRF